MRVVNAGKKVDVGNISVVVRVIRSVDFFRAIFVGFVRASFRFFRLIGVVFQSGGQAGEVRLQRRNP